MIIWTSHPTLNFNTIESIWRLFKVKICKLHPQGLTQLKTAILLSWRELDKNLTQNLIDSIPVRINKLIQAQGDSNDY